MHFLLNISKLYIHMNECLYIPKNISAVADRILYFFSDLHLALSCQISRLIYGINLYLIEGWAPSFLDMHSAIGPAAMLQRQNLLFKSMTLGITQQWWLSKGKSKTQQKKFFWNMTLKLISLSIEKKHPSAKR